MVSRRRKGNSHSEKPKKERSPSRRTKKLRGSKYGISRCMATSLRRLVGFLLVGIACYLHPEWITSFLGLSWNTNTSFGISEGQGEDLARDEGMQMQEGSQSRPTDIFTGFTKKEKKQLEQMQSDFNQKLNSGHLIPCDMKRNCSAVGPTGLLGMLRGSSTGDTILIQNTLPFHRYLCGKIIWGNGGTLEMATSKVAACYEDYQPYVYTHHPPPLSGDKVKPVELFWESELGGFYEDLQTVYDETLEKYKCTVPCLKYGYSDLLSVISIKGTRWEILSTMEGETYYSMAKFRHKSHTLDQYYALTSFRSEIPMPYFSWAEYNIQNPAVNFDTAIKGASFIARNCEAAGRRGEVVSDLIESELRVDSLSDCFHNADPPRGLDLSNKTALQEQYLFHLAFENQETDDYITEKLWGTLTAGTLPVYFGAPNVKEHVPPKSVVFVDDFDSTQQLANYLIRLTKDKALYESYHAWRNKPLDKAFTKKYNFTRTHSVCRMCKWAYSKRHGLQWNHEQQEVENPHISHKTCRNKMGLVGHPFKEYWLDPKGTAVSVSSSSNVKTCSIESSNRLLVINDGRVKRKVYDQDGVTDFIIEFDEKGKARDAYILQLETPLKSASNLQSIDPVGQAWWWQDSQSRMTILSDLPVEVSVAGPGTLQVTIKENMKLRFIIENIDTFYKGARKTANYFGTLMHQDFFTPLKTFLSFKP